MTVHLGIVALMILITAVATLRMRRRRELSDLLLVILAVSTAGLEGAVAWREVRFNAAWSELSRVELQARSERIVDFLKTKGSDALVEIRAIGGDPDTRSLLEFSRAARRPVFLDLRERFPAGGKSGATIYDLQGTPRAWSGWAPTATTSLAREPSRELESVSIRDGNIYTLLEAIHPVRAEDGTVLGYVVYQEPLRVQFPLENRLLRVEDALERLEGGGGVRADVALELRLDSDTDLRGIRAGALKLNAGNEVASSTAAILAASGQASGRVSLSGLTRRGMFLDRLAVPYRVRAALLLVVLVLVAVRLWFLAARVPRLLIPALRIPLLVASRWVVFLWAPRETLDWLGIFDPTWFASIRFGGLLRSPGDLLLTSAVLLLALRELRRLVVAGEPALSDFGRRYPWASIPLAAIAATWIGSVVGLHWDRVVDIARNANAHLYGGLDPFTSAPVAALEISLLFIGVGLLLAGDALGTMAICGFARARRWLAGGVVVLLALAASAAKMGTPSEVVPTDFLRPLPALLVLVAFHLVSRRWQRPGGVAILLTALIAALGNAAPLFSGVGAKQHELVELFALDHMESPSNSRHFLLERTLDYLSVSEELLGVLEDGPGAENANLAFILWARSPLANDPNAGCHLRIRNPAGETFSRFSLGFPADLEADFGEDSSPPSRAETTFRREDVGGRRVDVYQGRIPLRRAGRPLGVLELAIAYPDELGESGRTDDDLARVFTNLSASDEFLRFAREIPHRIDRYRGDELVASTNPEGGLGTRIHPRIVRALAAQESTGQWVDRQIQGHLWDLYCVRERDGNLTVGYLTFGIERLRLWDMVAFIARSALVSLVLTAGLLATLMLVSRLLPRGAFPHRLDVPRPGFRERVIGGFLIVSLLPTALLGLAGRSLFVQEKRQEFEERLQEDLRVSRELLGRRLSDAARNAAGADEVRALFDGKRLDYRTLSTPASVSGIVVMSNQGQLLGASRQADLDMALLPAAFESFDEPLEFFRRRGKEVYACALVPVSLVATGARPPGAVLAFQRVDEVLATELERRVGSSVTFFAGGQLAATSRPELYQSEILSDLVASEAYQKIELEGARQTLQEIRVGETAFLSSCAPLLDQRGEPAGIMATIAPFLGGGLDLDASLILSRIYFLCLLVLTAAIVAALLLANRLTDPISELTQGAERIRSGRLGGRIHSNATGEIGRLVRSFNQMSQQLAESEARDRERREYIEAIIRHVGSGVVSFDAEGRVATVNEAASRILDVDPAAVLGSLASEVRGGAALDAVLGSVKPLLEGRRTEVVDEIEVEAPDDPGGELRTFRLVGTPLADRDGNPQGAVAVFEDLSDLIKSKKITAWAEMARQVAHEIKNPLTPMKLSAQHLRQAWKDRHPKFDRILDESTETIVDRCEALRRIAIEFSDYARMPGRRIRREDLGQLLGEARRLYGDGDERPVDFTMEAPRHELYARVDKDEVMRLFINLIENSMQAMPSGGDLTVRAHRENGAAQVVIRDTGVGITPDNLRRIFEPSFSTKTGGAGLGLPICRAIMEDYGGSIEIDSHEGQGTTVTLLFPVDDAKGPEEAESDADS